MLTVRLFRPFPVDALLEALPSSVRSVAVLDRTKEPGAPAEPLCLDVAQTLADAAARGARPNLPLVVGGRYGLGSKDFTPAMAKAVFDHLRNDQPRAGFTVGILASRSSRRAQREPSSSASARTGRSERTRTA